MWKGSEERARLAASERASPRRGKPMQGVCGQAEPGERKSDSGPCWASVVAAAEEQSSTLGASVERASDVRFPNRHCRLLPSGDASVPVPVPLPLSLALQPRSIAPRLRCETCRRAIGPLRPTAASARCVAVPGGPPASSCAALLCSALLCSAPLGWTRPALHTRHSAEPRTRGTSSLTAPEATGRSRCH